MKLDINTHYNIGGKAFLLMGGKIEEVLIMGITVKVEQLQNYDCVSTATYKVVRTRDNFVLREWVQNSDLFDTREDLIASL